MTAMTDATKQKNYRNRKAATMLSKRFLEGKVNVTPEEFHEAKRDEFNDKHGVSGADFDQGMLNQFYERVKNELPENDGFFAVIDLMAIWNEEEK